MPSGNPGKFSTSVVRDNCPPGSCPSITKGLRLARAVYKAAVCPAQPDPTITTFRTVSIALLRFVICALVSTEEFAHHLWAAVACLVERLVAEPPIRAILASSSGTRVFAL